MLFKSLRARLKISAMTARLAGVGKGTPGRMTMLDGSHLFPMKKPLATAAAIEASLRNLGA